MTAAELLDWPDEWARHKLQKAMAQSALCAAQVQGMKNRAAIDPPTAAAAGFPYPARTCAEWTAYDDWLERQ